MLFFVWDQSDIDGGAGNLADKLVVAELPR